MPFDFNNDPVKIYGIWPLTPFPVEASIYGVCSNSCFYCNRSDQPVLMADLLYKAIGDVKAGDQVMGWSDESDKKTARGYTYRTWQVSEVLDVFRREAPIVRFIVEDGEDVYCTPDHYWFTGRAGAYWGYHPLVNKQTGELRDAAELVRIKDFPIMYEKEESREYRVGYLRGYAESEGTWMPQATWRFVSTDMEPLERIREYLKLEGIEVPENRPYPGSTKGFESKKPSESIYLPVDSPANALINDVDIENIDYFRGWLSGMYDAEGNTPSRRENKHSGALRISQYKSRYPLIYNRIERALRLLGFGFVSEENGIRLVGGITAAARFCQLVKPAIERKKNPYVGGSHRGYVDHVKVIGMEPAGIAEVIALKTTTGNYVVKGYLSRNCFSNLNRAAAGRRPEDHRKNPVEKVINGCERAMRDEKDPIGYFLRERYPICFSNTTDPFMKEEKTFRCTEAFLKWAKKRAMPLWIQTKGGVLLEDFGRYKDLIVAGKDAAYITLTTLDDGISRKIEPGAPASSDRLRLMRMLSDRGVPVVAACNPYLKEWCPDPAAYVSAVQSAGARGVWLEQLHFTQSQIGALPEAFGEYALKANLHPMYYIGELKSWYLATESAGIDFYPSPQWDEMFGCRSRFPECADPAWFGEGGKLFSWNFDLMREISRIAHEGQAPYDGKLSRRNNGKPAVVFWGWIEKFLQDSGCPNPVLRTGPFWVPFNAKQTADHREWKAKLGKEASLYGILKHFYNHPEAAQLFFWVSPLCQELYDYEADGAAYETDADARVAVFNPKNRHDWTPRYDVKKLERAKGRDPKSYVKLIA